MFEYPGPTSVSGYAGDNFYLPPVAQESKQEVNCECIVSCKEPSKLFKLILEAVVQSGILFTILTVFFIKIVSKEEDKATLGELKQLTGSKLQQLFKEYDESTNNKLCNVLKNSGQQLERFREYFSTPERLTEAKNKSVISRAMLIGGSLLITFIMMYIVSLTTCNLCDFFVPFIIETILVFILVGLAEYTFFKKIAIHFVPVLPSTLASMLLKDLKKK